MPALDLIDHSPQHPAPADPVASASNLVLIDNYDSFTWNVYQYLILEGATVTVFRNDEISLEDLIAKEPTQLVLSPGPGHPDQDSGICKDAINHFAGKIPILGVCMGEQCVYSAFGGTVEGTGEILHGKTSPLRHDGKGVYAGLAQDLPVTRYHSLAGTHPTLPQCLEISSWIAVGPDGGKGVIMGVRHKEYIIEGVQFHPESILTAEGRTMLKNFLKMQGGTWAENDRVAQKMLNGGSQPKQANGAATKPSGNILERIFDHRRAAVVAQKELPSQRPEDLQAAYDLSLAPPQIDFTTRLRQSPFQLSLMAEIKRASPSKGIISLSACAPAQARTYALAGASVISVLTEPEWFKGSIDDLRSVRQALVGMPHRPAVLRKEFIFEEYQILEARLAGADTVLLIVKMLDTPTLTRLYKYSQFLGMEPLVEVNTIEEMKIAVDLGSKVIGVNNRNLTNFEVDLDTTSRLMSLVPQDTLVCALSGISGPKDVEPYSKNRVGAVLVGEALMRAKDTAAFIRELLGSSDAAGPPKPKQDKRLVKICGTRSPEAAKAAIEAGADLIGIILVTGRKRCVSAETALEISYAVHNTRKPSAKTISPSSSPITPDPKAASSPSNHSIGAKITNPHNARLVGVFLDQSLNYITKQVHDLNLDIVQLHGSEPLEWAQLIPCPVMKVFHPTGTRSLGLNTRGCHALSLLDSGIGGTGEKLDLGDVKAALERDADTQVLLAGGLNASNVQEILQDLGPLASRVAGVDVSSGVEEDGQQSIGKIRDFITTARRALDSIETS